MKTISNSILLPYLIETESLEACWYKNGQMIWHIERKNGKYHGDCKQWVSNGDLFRHRVYENGKFVKIIV